MAELLILALLHFAPNYLDEASAALHVEAATAAAEAYDFPVELLLAQAFVESRYQPTTLSMQKCLREDGKCPWICSKPDCGRKTRQWDFREPPDGARPSFYCGVMQVGGWISWDECVALMEDIPTNYMEGAAELRKWTKDRYCRPFKGKEERLRCALRAYGGGYPAIPNLEMEYPDNVLNTAAILRRLAKEDPSA
jgi:hypothetical protein